ncbi:response regulator [Lachnospiraceae bacterium ZAX-1]
MKNKLLFVNRKQNVIDDFLEVMQSYDFEIDATTSGVDATVLLEKNTYKVVITGMSLSATDGTRLIAYLNKHHPDTICIVYTTRLDLAHLNFLINEREVFRIFIQPANYHGDFYQAIKEGFDYYDLKMVNLEEEASIVQKQYKYKETLSEVQKLVKRRKEGLDALKSFLLPILKMSVQRYSKNLEEQEQMHIIQYEEEMLGIFLNKEYRSCKTLKDVEDAICEEFEDLKNEGKLYFSTSQCPDKVTGGFYETVHLVIWLLYHRYKLLANNKFEGEVRIRFETPLKAVLTIDITLSEEIIAAHNSMPVSMTLTFIAQSVVKNIVDAYEEQTGLNVVSYKLELLVDTDAPFEKTELIFNR